MESFSLRGFQVEWQQGFSAKGNADSKVQEQAHRQPEGGAAELSEDVRKENVRLLTMLRDVPSDELRRRLNSRRNKKRKEKNPTLHDLAVKIQELKLLRENNKRKTA